MTLDTRLENSKTESFLQTKEVTFPIPKSALNAPVPLDVLIQYIEKRLFFWHIQIAFMLHLAHVKDFTRPASNQRTSLILEREELVLQQ